MFLPSANDKMVKLERLHGYSRPWSTREMPVSRIETEILYQPALFHAVFAEANGLVVINTLPPALCPKFA